MKGSIHLVVPGRLRREMEDFLSDRSEGGREAFAFLLCGRHRYGSRNRLLARHLVLPEEACFRTRSAGRIECDPGFDRFVLGLADAESLAVVALHTHIQEGAVRFSFIDDSEEERRARAMRGVFGTRVPLGSVVFDRKGKSPEGRFWRSRGEEVLPVPMKLVSAENPWEEGKGRRCVGGPFERQVQAFGAGFQSRIQRVRVGLVGTGGLGSLIVEGLSRLGVRKWVLVDPDHVEPSNLNRLSGATGIDALDRTPKVEVARRAIRAVHGTGADIAALQVGLPDREASRRLAGCDLLVAATDNHASRLVLQEIASAFLLPLVNAGVRLVASGGEVRSVEARVTSPPLGGPWCLACGGQIDLKAVAIEQADPEHRSLYSQRGYLPENSSPAVQWVNAAAAARVCAMVHDLVFPFQDEHREGREIYLDLLNDEVLRIDREEGGDGCPVCGAGELGLRGIGDTWLRMSGRSRGEVPNLFSEEPEGGVTVMEGMGPEN